jgi:flavin-dependent thymidylate synthase
VTRAFTQQLERHRIGTSFAEQSLRAVDMSGFEYLATGATARDGVPEARDTQEYLGYVKMEPRDLYADAMRTIDQRYTKLVNNGVAVQDARGLLPMNILTNITFKANLRTLHEMGLKRLCVRTQGEFQDVFREILACVTEVHPWAERFIRVQCAWNGTCLFPLLPLDKCFVKPHVYNPETGRRYDDSRVHDRPATTAEIVELHRARRQELQPVVVKKDA